MRLRIPLVAALALSIQAGPVDPSLYSQLKFRYIGPVGNRISAVAGSAR